MDLGVKHEPVKAMIAKEDTKKKSYPTLYVNGIEENELPEGEFSFTGKGKVVSSTESTRNGKKVCSFELEVMEIEPDQKAKKKAKSEKKDGADGLDGALGEIEKKKMKQESPDEEAAEESSGNDNDEEESDEES